MRHMLIVSVVGDAGCQSCRGTCLDDEGCKQTIRSTSLSILVPELSALTFCATTNHCTGGRAAPALIYCGRMDSGWMSMRTQCMLSCQGSRNVETAVFRKAKLSKVVPP
jgi:hypothetical protein